MGVIAGAAFARHAAEDDQPGGSLAIDAEFDGSAESGGLDGAREFAGVDIDRLGGDAAAVDVPREAAIAAEVLDFLTQDDARGRLERNAICHGKPILGATLDTSRNVSI